MIPVKNLRQSIHYGRDSRKEFRDEIVFQSIEALRHVLERILESCRGLYIVFRHNDSEVMRLFSHGLDFLRRHIQQSAHLCSAFPEQLLSNLCAFRCVFDACQSCDGLFPQLFPAHFLRVFCGNAERLKCLVAVRCRR